MLRLPPTASVPPCWASPLVKAPVVKLTDPRFEPMADPNLKSVEPVRDNPDALPVMVPPAFDTSMLLSAYAIRGNASASTAKRNARLITTLLNPLNLLLQLTALFDL